MKTMMTATTSMVSRRRRRGIPPGRASGRAPRSMIICVPPSTSLCVAPCACAQPPPSMWFAFAESCAQGGRTRKALFRDCHHRTNDRIARLCIQGKRGDHHEDVACWCRLGDRSGFCLSSFRSSILHLATQSLRLRRLRPIGTYRAGRWAREDWFPVPICPLYI